MGPLNTRSLPEEARVWVEERVASGLYESPEDVLSAAMEALELYELREQVQLGIQQLDAGMSTKYDQNSLEQLKTRIKERGAARLAALPRD